MSKSFQQTQRSFTEYLRNSTIATSAIPEDRKTEIYRELAYKNINHCIATTLPISKSYISERDWRELILDFIATHHCQTPYFLEICQEFLSYLIGERQTGNPIPAFLLELAHFEWIQMHLYVADIDFPTTRHRSNATQNSLWQVSPLVIGLTYSYPVHRIENFSTLTEPDTTQQIIANTTYLLVYRNRGDEVEIFETDRMTLRVVQFLQDNEGSSCSQIYQELMTELEAHSEKINLEDILSILSDLSEREILLCLN